MSTAVLERKAVGISFIPLDALPDTPITGRTVEEFRTKISLGELRVAYHHDLTIDFHHVQKGNEIGGKHVKYHPVDLSTGSISTFDDPLSPDLVTLLRAEKARAEAQLHDDPRPNKFVTEKVRNTFAKAKSDGKFQAVHTENQGVVFSWRREIPGGKVEFGQIDLERGVIQGTPSYPHEMLFAQGMWELIREEAEYIRQEFKSHALRYHQVEMTVGMG